MGDDYLNLEEDFLTSDRKESRKMRRLASKLDRSKYKKTDEKAYPPPPQGDFDRGRVLSITSDGIEVKVEDTVRLCSLKGALKKDRSHQKNLVIIGDFVLMDDTTIVYVEKRSSHLSRAENLSRKKVQLIAANIDQVFIVASIDDPTLKPSLIDRYIIAARSGNMEPIIVINKLDLLEKSAFYKDFKKAYSKLGIQFIEVSAKTKKNLAKLKKAMKHKTSVFSGQSGVGKTSILNEILGMDMKIGEVAPKTRKGSHTTTASKLIPLKDGAFCIDTPGIKSFGLWQIDKDNLASYFPDIDALSPGCKFSPCKHFFEPDCAVKDAVDDGKLSQVRYESYLALLTKED
ncbi:MAG: Small ribosomal subunit biogenesis GTPase RsgA [Chlamydiia bacterium]|nr:Small ribosomal subunit biogenesis GTPase RsgA [Chlamydiia bacterium]MCH9616464.1 Small ribosomal subunit biogenesis GTPase RsgA [Chlamydiia bacterium]MCH9629550.1 Small ribosomal subunit biogenesis GTPase RsgA [Chlamydiia bacterium]